MYEPNGQQESPRYIAINSLLTALDDNDSRYLAGEIERAEWLEKAKGIDERLAVAGLRLAVRPWVSK